MKGSWKTSALGICALLTAIGVAGTALLDGNPDTKPDFASIATAFAGLGLLFARDNDKSSEDVGVN